MVSPSHEKVIVVGLQADLRVWGRDRWGPGTPDAKVSGGAEGVAQLKNTCIQSPAPCKPSVVGHTCNPNTWEVKVVSSGVQGHPWLCSIKINK